MQDHVPGGPSPEPSAQAKPPLTMRAQYLKDLSFESFQPPTGAERSSRPTGEVSVDLTLDPIEGDVYEVGLRLRVNASIDGKPAYAVEVDYRGRFEVPGGNNDETKRMLMAKAPALLFPFARAIIYNATLEGGFPALNINPVDFRAVYRERKLAAKKRAARGGG